MYKAQTPFKCSILKIRTTAVLIIYIAQHIFHNETDKKDLSDKIMFKNLYMYILILKLNILSFQLNRHDHYVISLLSTLRDKDKYANSFHDNKQSCVI